MNMEHVLPVTHPDLLKGGMGSTFRAICVGFSLKWGINLADRWVKGVLVWANVGNVLIYTENIALQAVLYSYYVDKKSRLKPQNVYLNCSKASNVYIKPLGLFSLSSHKETWTVLNRFINSRSIYLLLSRR